MARAAVRPLRRALARIGLRMTARESSIDAMEISGSKKSRLDGSRKIVSVSEALRYNRHGVCGECKVEQAMLM